MKKHFTISKNLAKYIFMVLAILYLSLCCLILLKPNFFSQYITTVDTGSLIQEAQITNQGFYKKELGDLKSTSLKEQKVLLETNRVIAHRGAAFDYPENSTLAFENAKEYWGVETDIYPTKDGFWVCAHDATIDHYTEGKGEISQLTLAEIQSYSIKNKNGFHLKIPTLQEFLAICQKSGVTPIIEIKESGSEDMTGKLLTLVKEYSLLDQAIISSFNFSALEEVRKQNTSIQLLLLSRDPIDPTLELAKKIQPVSIGMRYDRISEEEVKKVHQQNSKLFAWTPKKKIDILESKLLGVDAIITDRIMDDFLSNLYLVP